MKTNPMAQTLGFSKVKKAALLLFSVAVLLGGGAAAVRGQSALDGFDPNANGTVRVIVVQPDGKILIGGTFTTVFGVARTNIARLNPDGALDTTFNPNASSDVYAIAVQADGRVLVGGDFINIGGQMRNFIARLDATTGLADSFNPNANNIVQSIAVQTNGNILAGGRFTNIGGQPRIRIARLDPVTGLADSFDPSANATVFSIAVQADGKVLAGGQFSNIGGQTRFRIARLDAVTGAADSFNPNPNDIVYSIVVQADGKILAGGSFFSIDGQTRNYIARLDATTGAADSFDPNANAGVYSIAMQADGKVLAGGNFSTIGGQTRVAIARLDRVTGLADSFNPRAQGGVGVYSIAVQQDGKILAGGDFTTLAPNGGAAVTRNRIARLETDGRLDQTLNLGTVNGLVTATAVQPDGKILIGGDFTTILGVTRNRIARLNTDGTLDTTFNSNPTFFVNAIVVLPDSKILVGAAGGFLIGGQTRIGIAKLNTDGTLDTAFNASSDSAVLAIAVQTDGKILVGGDFTSIGGQTRNYIARLDPTTGLADSWDPNAVAGAPCCRIHSIAVQTDGKILAAGDFTIIGGQTRYFIARLDPTTGLADSFNPIVDFVGDVRSIMVQENGKILVSGVVHDNGRGPNLGGQSRNYIGRLDATGAADSFNPNANQAVVTIAVQADGRVLTGGYFTTIGGQTRNHIARLDSTTGSADSFDAITTSETNAAVFSIAAQADGRVLVGGNNLTSIGGQTRSNFARLSNDTAALQNLAVTPTTITWTRGGSSPQLTRVTFEYSTDNVNYTSLGNGTAAGSNWTLTGLSLTTGQNIYIRARGYYRTGIYNSSQSITESVRNAFLTQLVAKSQPLLNIQRSANTNVVLSWATNFTGFTLEASTSLDTNVWSVVSPAPAVSGANNVVTNAISGSTRIYRLRR